MNRELKKQMDASKEVNKAIYSNVVGKCMQILKDYVSSEAEPSLEGFKNYYYRTKTIKPLVKAICMVMSEDYSLNDAAEYVDIRVFEDTWNGHLWEYKAKQWLKDKYDLDCRFANWEEDAKYCVDLIGDNFAIQVKPITYKKGSNPSLMKDRESHLKQHRKYEEETNKSIRHIFYDKNTGKLTIENYR